MVRTFNTYFLNSNQFLIIIFFLELYYGGEVITVDQPQSFTCPYCGRMGFTDVVLQEHVCAEHPEMSLEVVSLPSLRLPESSF